MKPTRPAKPTKQVRDKVLEIANLIHEIEALSVVIDLQITSDTEDELMLLHEYLWDKIYQLFAIATTEKK